MKIQIDKCDKIKGLLRKFLHVTPSWLFKHSVMSDSLWRPGLQHARLPCPSPFPRALLKFMTIEVVMPSNHLNLCHPLLFMPSTFSASGSFLMSQLFESGGQSSGPSASVLPMNIQAWFSLGLTGWIPLQAKRLSRVFSNTTVQKHQFFGSQPSLWSHSDIHTWLLEKLYLWVHRHFWLSNVSVF